MIISEYRQNTYQILYLIAKTIDAQQIVGQRDRLFAESDISSLLEAAKKHSLSAITAYALQNEGVQHSELTPIYAKAMRNNILTDREFKTVADTFSHNHIHYLPLKGIYLKALYPKPWMREMSDVDILVEKDSYDAVKTILCQNGYASVLFNKNNEDVYRKPPSFVFEIHRTLFDPERFPEIQAYFDQKQYKSDADNPYLWLMPPTDAYIYLIAHLYMHYQASGTGLRSLLDVYLYLRRYEKEMDFSYIGAQLKAIGADEFEKKIRNLSQGFLNPDALSQSDRDELDYFIFSGTYGTRRQYIRNRIARKSDGSAHGKKQYIRYRFKVPNNRLKEHPFYLRHPKMRPLLATTRVVKAVITKPKMILTELKELHNAQQPPHKK